MNSHALQATDGYVKRLLIPFSATLVVSLAAALLVTGWWDKVPMVHLLSELLCVFASLVCFVASWLCFDWETAIPRYAGFGLLSVAIVDLLHILFAMGTDQQLGGWLTPAGLWAAARLLAALTLFVTAHPPAERTFSRWRLLLFALGCAGAAIGLTASLISSASLLGDSPLGGVVQRLPQWLVVALLLTAMRAIPTAKRRYAAEPALLVAMLAIVVNLVMPSAASHIGLRKAWGHLLRLGCYLWLLRYCLFSAFSYPRIRLQTAYQSLQSIFDGLPVGVVTISAQGEVIFVNQKLACAFDLPAGWHSGTYVSDILDSLRARGCQFQTDDSTITPSPEQETMVVRYPDGEHSHWHLESRPLFGGGSVILVTESWRELGLAELRAETKSILDALADLVLLVDGDGLVLTCNQAFAAATGWEAAQVRGLFWLDVIKRLSPDIELSQLRLDSQQVLGFRLQLPQGATGAVLLRSSPVYGLERRCSGYVVAISDITQYRYDQAQLYQHAKLSVLGDMAQGLIHEIRNPLTVIKGFSQLLSQKLPQGHDRQFVVMMMQQANAVERIIADYLSLSRQREPKLEQLPLSALGQCLAVPLQGLAALHRVQFTYHCDDGGTQVLVDEGQISQVVLNMAKNACEAMEGTTQPRLLLRLSLRAGWVDIAISDNGKGIPAGELAKLGTPFYSTKPKGTGLGLHLCYRIIDAHGGHVQAESQVGVGTTFHIRLPAC